MKKNWKERIGPSFHLLILIKIRNSKKLLTFIMANIKQVSFSPKRERGLRLCKNPEI